MTSPYRLHSEGRTLSQLGGGALGFLLAMCLLMFAGTSSASALSPWWHLSSGSRPTDLHEGSRADETQEITVSATKGTFYLEDPATGASDLFPSLPYDATHEEVQKALEGLYGEGNVRVPRGQGDETGSNPYLVEFAGELTDHQVSLNVGSYDESFACKSFQVCPLERGAEPGTVVAKQVTEGYFHGPEIVLIAANLGDASVDGETSEVKIADKLPAGLEALFIEGVSVSGNSSADYGSVTCKLTSMTCSYTGHLPAYRQLEVRIAVALKGATSGALNEVTVSGGGAPNASLSRRITVGDTTQYGVESYELSPEAEGGTAAVQAGSHPFQLTTTIALNQLGTEAILNGKPVVSPPALTKDENFKLPPGLIGNPTPFARCTMTEFTVGACPASSVVGVAMVTYYIPTLPAQSVVTSTLPLVNLQPGIGEPARFGFLATQAAPVLIDTSVRTGEDYGVTASVSNITQLIGFLGAQVTFWGVPGDARHDGSRGEACLQGEGTCAPLGERVTPPLLTLPTSCAGAPLQSQVEVDSWANRMFLSYPLTEPIPMMEGCNRLPFEPSIKVTPDGQAGSTPTGLNVSVQVQQEEALNPVGLSPADVKDTTVTLPSGVTLNPAAADGLQACSDVAEPGRPEGEISLHSPGKAFCPEASKVATVQIHTPLLPEPLTGAAYLAAQDKNPFGSLVALYIVAEDPTAGVIVKLAGEVKPDPVTGQLVSTFLNTPQLPFETLELHFFGGDRAPLSTPSACGEYTTTAAIEPWAQTGEVDSKSTFDVIGGPNGSPCRSPLPFSPSLTAGTTSIQAGGFSPFTMTMSRPDGSQNLQAIKLTMPPGLLGTLASVKLCKEAQANAGTCGPESLIGHTVVSVGVGGDPYTVTGGEVFITEGYEGAPYGLSIVNPAKAGPFDLGKVVVRAKIEVDPLTATLTITTDNSGPYKIPTILDGIPLQIQHVEVSVDRQGFTFNPTNCSPLQIGGSLYSSEGSSAVVKVPFQITNCAVLAFKPKLTAKTAGKTSRKIGASLSVKLTYPAGPFDANIAKVKVDLPKQLPSRLTTLQQACPAKVFEANPASCPSASIVGHAKASTPVLPVPLSGPAYFVSHAGEEFPDLIIVLQGYGTTVHLVGSTFIDNKTGVTSSTFKTIPDVPVGTFELTLPQGKYSALAANGNLCILKLAMPTSFIAQNGAEIHTSTPITPTGCVKHKTNKKTKSKKASHKGTTHKKKK